MARIIGYERVSTARQGASGLGLEAQRRAISTYAKQRDAVLIARFTEVESGRNADRPELAKALHLTKVTGATLVIAKLDRLSRSAAFLLALRDSGVRFSAVDLPEANDLTVGIMALVAQQERERRSPGAPGRPGGGSGARCALRNWRSERSRSWRSFASPTRAGPSPFRPSANTAAPSRWSSHAATKTTSPRMGNRVFVKDSRLPG